MKPRGTHFRRGAVAGSVALLLAWQSAVGADGAKKRPDLSGFWMLAPGQPDEDPVLKSKLSPGAVILKDSAAIRGMIRTVAHLVETEG